MVEWFKPFLSGLKKLVSVDGNDPLGRWSAEYNENPAGYPRLPAAAIEDYLDNVAVRIRPEEGNHSLKELIERYPPEVWIRNKKR